MKKFVLFLSVLFCGFYVSVSAKSLGDLVLESSVYKAYKTSGFESSVSEYNSLKNNKKISEQDFMAMMKIYSDKKDLDKSMEVGNEALKKYPNSYNTYTLLAMDYANLKRYDEAILAYSDSIKIKPTEPAYYNRGQIFYYIKKDYGRAISDFTKAIEYISQLENPSTASFALADIYRLRALSYEKKQDYSKSIEDYDSAIKYNQSEPDLYYNRAVVKRLKASDSKLSKKESNALINSSNIDLENALEGYRKNNNMNMYNKIKKFKTFEAVKSVIK